MKKIGWLLFISLFYPIYGKAQVQHDTLLILDDGGYAPYSFAYIDKKGQNNVSGILVDIWKLWSKKTGIPIKFDLGHTFSEAIQQINSGKKAIILGICPKYRHFPILYSAPYYTVTAQPIIKKEAKIFFKSLDEGNYVFGTCEGDVVNEILKAEHKNITVKTINGYSKLLDSLIEGRVTGILLEEPVFKYRLFERGMLNKLNDFVIMPDFIPEPICAGSSDPTLIKLVDAGFKQISTKEIKAIESKWIKKYEPNLFRSLFHKILNWIGQNPFLAIGLGIVLFLLFINAWLLYIYFHKPWKLLSIKYFFDNFPEIKIPLKNFNISIRLLLITNFLVRSKRTYIAYHKRKSDNFLKVILANLDIQRLDYLPLPIKVNERSPGLLPLGNNLKIIKEFLQTIFSNQPILKIIISGNGGIGKTTLCAQIVKWVLENPRFFPAPSTFVPMDFRGIDENLAPEEFKKLSQTTIFESFNSLFEKKIDRSFFQFCLNNGFIILLIDGFSEYSSVKRAKISAFINSWEKDKMGLLITSRFIDYSIGEFNIIMEPGFLTSAFLINQIQLVYMKSYEITELGIEDSRKINDLFNLLNRITRDHGVTPLFCTLFSRELASITLPHNVSDDTGLNKFYEQIFIKYIKRVIQRIQNVNSDNLEKTVEKIKNFAAFFAWKQISVDDTFCLNNYLSINDLLEFPNAEDNLRFLNSAGSFLIENEELYKIKFDPIAEFLVNLHLYKGTREDINCDALQRLIIEPYTQEKLLVLESFCTYLKDLMINDRRTEDILVIVEDNIHSIRKTFRLHVDQGYN